MVRGYQILISPLILSNCRFIPSCSEYSIQALQKRGPIVGGFLTVKRLLRCLPFRPLKVDEV